MERVFRQRHECIVGMAVADDFNIAGIGSEKCAARCQNAADFLQDLVLMFRRWDVMQYLK